MATTVLAHLAGSFAQKENLATEALAFILNRSEAARTAVRNLVKPIVGEIAVARVATQVKVAEGARPDLILRDANGIALGYVEAKFWAPLTKAQPVDYVKRLQDDGGGALVLLAPEARLPTLHAEVLTRLASMTLEDVLAHSLRIGDVRVGLISWRALLDALTHSTSGDAAVASDVAQLRGFIERFEADGFLPLAREELDDLAVPRRIRALEVLVAELFDAAVAAGLVTTKGTRGWASDPGYWGGWAAFPTAWAWMGITHWQWGTRGRTPIWCTFAADKWGRAGDLRKAFEPWAAENPPRAYLDDVDETIRLPLVLPVGVEKDAVIGNVIAQLRAIGETVQSAKLSQLGEEAPAAAAAK